MKKPRLTVVPSKPNALAPPATLGQAGAKLWQRIQSEFRVDDAPGAATLEEICAAADRLAEYAEVIAHDGPVIRTKTGGMRDHPLLKHELQTRAFITRALQRLNLDVEAPRDTVGRPPGFKSDNL
jgi:hypothetical protein